MMAFMHTMICLLAFVWITSCKQSNDQVLVTIGNKDSITTAELNEAVKAQFGDDSKTVSRLDKKKLLMGMVDNQLFFQASLDMKVMSDSAFQASLARAQENIVRQAALEKYVYRNFINEKTISVYAKNYDKSLDVQNLVIAYFVDKKSKTHRTKDVARQLSDSIYSNATMTNFNLLIEQFSDNIDPHTGKGNIRPQRMVPGSLPFWYEQKVLSSQPNTITPPIEIPGAFVITKLGEFKQSKTSEILSYKHIAAMLKEKLEMSDHEILLNRYNQLIDSLKLLIPVQYHETQIDSFMSLIRDQGDGASLMERINASKILVSFANGQNIDMRQFVNSYKLGTWSAMNRNMVHERLTQLANDVLLREALRSEGYTSSDEFHFKTREWTRQFAVGVLKNSKFADTTAVSIEELRRYYEDHREQFAVPGNLKILEVYSVNFDALDSVAQLVDDKVDLVKAAEQINGKKKDRAIVIKEPSNYLDNQNDELVKKALSLKPGEVSRIFQRKDGGYSMIRLMEKNEKKTQPFDAIKKQVEASYREERQKRMMEKFLHELKLKYPVVVYESNLK